VIKINLLSAEKPRAAVKSRLPRIDLKGQQLTVGCAVILIASAGIVGWRYQQLSAESKQVDAAIAGAQQETVRLHAVMGNVQKFEQRRTQLQQRVGLIEQLRKEQSGPVHMLDEISHALPPLMWLTDLKQTAGAAEVVIEGRCTGLTGLSDFVTNLEASGYFKKSVEIVSSQLDSQQNSGDLIKFVVKAQIAQAAAASAAAQPAGGPAAAPAAPPAKPAT
jgi:type IV pilus assembly protein PilN